MPYMYPTAYVCCTSSADEYLWSEHILPYTRTKQKKKKLLTYDIFKQQNHKRTKVIIKETGFRMRFNSDPDYPQFTKE